MLRIMKDHLYFKLLLLLVCGMVLSAPVYAAERTDGFSVEAEAGVGYDSNIYLSPDDDYINYALPGNPATDPEVQSGYFIPLKLKGGYLSTLQNQNRYIARYRFSGDFYVDPEHENANEYYHKLEGGIEHVFRNHGLIEDTLYAGAFLKYKKDVYFDRDTGDDQRSSVTGEDISNRYSYNSYGAEFEYKQRTTPVQFKVFGKYEKRDYEDPDVIAELDKTYYELGGEVEFDVAEPSELSFGYTYGVMDYDDKLARDSDGRLFASNDKLKYTYHEYEASLRNRLTDEVVVYLDYRYKTRTDDFEGYNDYRQHSFRVRGIYKDAAEKLYSRLALEYWTRDYPNAYAFDEPTQDDKQYRATEVKYDLEYALSQGWSAWGEADYIDQKCTDDRYEYDRYQVMLGAKWEH